MRTIDGTWEWIFTVPLAQADSEGHLDRVVADDSAKPPTGSAPPHSPASAPP
ncbi:hypothetical protein OG219_41525 [Streptomyces sp. NBC_00038]|nr:hypothetical protein [Streptomyces sp. NBC_00038]